MGEKGGGLGGLGGDAMQQVSHSQPKSRRVEHGRKLKEAQVKELHGASQPTANGGAGEGGEDGGGDGSGGSGELKGVSCIMTPVASTATFFVSL